MSRYFADLSNNNNQTVDWKAYRKAGHVLVGHKATEGSTFVDGLHAGRVVEAHKAGVWVIHYLFGHPNEDPKPQVDLFWHKVEPLFASKRFVHDFTCLDLETQDGLSWGQVADWQREADDYFHKLTKNKRAFIGYSGEYFMNMVMLSGGKWISHRGWIAAYGPNSPSVKGLPLWAWQRTDGKQGPEPHQLAGIGAPSDISILNRLTYLNLLRTKP